MGLRLPVDLGIEVKHRFAWWPVKLDSKKYIWLKSYIVHCVVGEQPTATGPIYRIIEIKKFSRLEYTEFLLRKT